MKIQHLMAGLQFMAAAMLLASCKQADQPVHLSDTEVIHQLQDELTQVIIYDVFTPPVASRIYAYTSLAGYEAIRFQDPVSTSLATRMKGFDSLPMPAAGKKYHYGLAYAKAFSDVAIKVIFSKDTLAPAVQRILDQYKNSLDPQVYQASFDFGAAIAEKIWQRAKDDNYLASRGKPKYLGSQVPGKWQPTAPDYLDGVEYCWKDMMPMMLDSASQFRPEPPPPYSTDSSSQFQQMVREVYQVSASLTEEQKNIARFWDDNPFVIEHSGHMMFGTKKITPGGHWMGIAAIASKQSKANAVKTAMTYSLTATALFDAFISCWDAKYTWSYVRPITVIHEQWDRDWKPMLQTPPFPEYTSGHSTITAAAATVLTKLYGDNFAFNDTSDLRYIGMQRSFSSFYQASDECSVSRLYGGIHYRISVDKGAESGRKVGKLISQKAGLP